MQSNKRKLIQMRFCQAPFPGLPQNGRGRAWKKGEGLIVLRSFELSAGGQNI